MRQTTSAKERFEATAFLHSVCYRTPAGLAEYKDGWNDQKVAAHTGVSIHVVAYARQQTIGPLHVKQPKVAAQPAPAIGFGAEAAMIADIRRHQKRLEEQNDLLEKRVKQVEDLLENYTRPHGGSNGLPRY